MRTTLTIDEDVAHRIRELMRERDLSFKVAVNDLLRRGLRAEQVTEPYESPILELGVQPGIDLDKALVIAGELENAELVRKSELGK